MKTFAYVVQKPDGSLDLFSLTKDRESAGWPVREGKVVMVEITLAIKGASGAPGERSDNEQL